jgi:hypothetical protein
LARPGGAGKNGLRRHGVDMAEPAPERSWWTTLPGVLTGLAALLTAVTGLLALVFSNLHGRGEPAPVDPARHGAAQAVSPALAPPARRDMAAEGQAARQAEAEPRRPIPAAPAPAAAQPRPGGVPPLVLGERLDIAGSSFEVLTLESASLRGQVREISVTFRVTAGETKLDLSRSNVRILTPGQVHTPVEGLPATAVPAGARRQFWVRFEIEEPVRDPFLSFTDDMFAPRGEARRALPGP